MEYRRFDPTDCGFPRPRVPLLASLNRRSLGRARPGLFRPLGLDGHARGFTRGRYALTEAYRQCGIGAGGALLAPAYHCRTMLDPAIRLGAKIVLYAMKPDLSPDLAALAAQLSTSQPPIKALLVTHYFGFAQALEPLARLCAKHGIALIEDCSHALFTRTEPTALDRGGAIGQTGRFCVASPYKFFPCEEGGILWFHDAQDTPVAQQRTPTLAQEFKGMLRSVQRWRESRHTSQLAAPDGDTPALPPPLIRTGQDVLEQDTHTSPHYVAQDEQLTSLAWSRWVMRYTNVARLAAHRRRHYQHWVNAVAGLPHCRALLPDLPPDCVPYMFPLAIDHPEIHFFALKQLGMPVWRWDDMAVSGCGVATDYRLKLLHLPCHQELSERQMTWMTQTLTKVMLTRSVGHP